MFTQIGRSKKQKESAEEKQKQDAETARVYADFVKSFECNADDETKAFIRGGIIDPSADGTASTTIDDKAKTVYKPQKKGLWLPPASEKKPTPVKAKVTSKHESKREIDSFLEEIKRKQQMQEEKRNLHKAQTEARTDEERDKISRQLEDLENATKGKGSIPGLVEAEQTTNLYLGNLSPEITEEFLCQQFGKFGVITSVKIMYPRTDEEKSRGRNCGFVSFEVREQAEAAKIALDGADFYGMVVRIGWGKAIAKPNATASNPIVPAVVNPTIADVEETVSQKAIRYVDVPVPTSKRVKTMIDTLAKYVAEEGHLLEHLVIEKEAKNEDFRFLFDNTIPESIYYRWRVFAYTQGDTPKSWRLDAFQMYNGGPMWRPPPETYFEEPPTKLSNFSDFPPEGVTAASAGPQHKQLIRANQTGAQRLSSDERQQLRDILAQLTKQRQSICDTMTFCLDHSDNSFEIAQYITDILADADISTDKMIAVLYLVSDILYNSSSIRQSAWSYRSAFESCLPDIFERLFAVKYKLDGRITMQQIKDIIMRILRIWEDWAVYPPQFFKGLEASFLSENNVIDIVSSNDISTLLGTPELVDTELDGKPLDPEIFNELIKYPVSVRPMVEEWMDMNTSQLERLCQRCGLSVKFASSRGELLKKLANFEIYWKQKEDMISKAVAATPPSVESAGNAIPNGTPFGLSELNHPVFPSADIYVFDKPVVDVPMELDSQLPLKVEDEALEGFATAGPLLSSKVQTVAEVDGGSDTSDDIFATTEDDDDIFKDVSNTSSEVKMKKDEEKALVSRKKLRQVELQVMELQVELEKKGLHSELILLKCDEMRQNLLLDCQREVKLESVH